MSQNAAVKPQLSQRARQLSQRRQKGTRHTPGQPVDLASQDQPMDNRESGLWVPASEHQTGAVYAHPADEDDDDDEDEQAVGAPNGEQRGREEARQVEA